MFHSLLSTSSATVDFALIVVLLFTVWQLYRGYRRGFKRQLIHTAFMAVSVIIAFAVSGSAADSIISTLLELDAGSLAAELQSIAPGLEIPKEIIDTLDTINMEILAYVISLPIALIVPPVVFLVLYFVITAIANILCSITLLCIGFLLGDRNKRNIGLAIGAVEGLAMAIILLRPIAGFSGLITDTTNTISNILTEDVEEAVDEDEDEDVDDYVDRVVVEDAESEFTFEYKESGTLRLVRKLGGDSTMRSLSTITINDEKYHLSDEYRNILSIISIVTEFDDTDFTALTSEDKAILDSTLERIYRSKYLTNVCSAVLQFLGGAMTYAEPLFDISPDYHGLIVAMAGVFSNGNADTFDEDLGTLKEAYYILSDSGVLSVFEDNDALSKALTSTDRTGRTVINRVTTLLNKNDRTRPIITELTKLSLKLMSTGDSVITEELYENVKGGVADAIAIDKSNYATEEEYKAAVTASLDNTLKENDIDLDPEIVADIADYIDENYEDLKDATDEQINEVILSYHDAYIEYLKNQENNSEE